MSLVEQREGIEAGRLDMFVDGAFAFTLTLLVIGRDSMPGSAAELLQVLGGIPAFAASFAMIAFFWHGHVNWRQHCLRADKRGLLLSLLFVFFALIFVYPLHMMFSGLFNAFSAGWLPSTFVLDQPVKIRALYICYGLAFTCMAGTLALLFGHAARCERRDGMSPLVAQREQLTWVVPMVLGLLSALLALSMPLSLAPIWWSLPGWLYALMFLIGPVTTRFERKHGMR
ncbi:MAG: TMEM175 family protein [Rhodanobacter sp.]